MKYLLITALIFLCPVFVSFAQTNSEKTELVGDELHPFDESYDWIREDEIGMVMAISGDSILYEEQWLTPAPNGLPITGATADETISMEMLEAPFRAQVTFYRQGKHLYVKKLQFLEQFRYDSEGCILDDK